MQDKPLDQAEQDLLEVIRQLHAENGPFLRSTLSVVGRGRGLDVARPLLRLKALGLVEEIEQRPFFLKRLFGAKSSVFLQPGAAALADSRKSGGTPLAAEPAPVAPPIAPEPLTPPEPPPLPVAPEPLTLPLPGAPEPLIVQPEPAPAPVVAPAEPTEPAPPPAVPPRPVRFTPDAYTDEVGGQPLAPVPLTLAPGLDPELLDGLREMIEVLGMEMTMAGEALIIDRMGKGASAGEALAQVALYAFAHAARHDMLAGSPVQAVDLHDYAIEVIRELEKLRDAGEIGAEPFERDMRAIWALADKSTDRSPQIADLLADPMGGAAPPALLPEDVRGTQDYAD